jgi:glucose-1-phosphatase
MSDIKNIIFDLGGIILNINYLKTSQCFKNFGVVNFDDLYTQENQSLLFEEFEKGNLSSQQFLNELRQKTGLTENKIISAWNAMLLDLPKERLNFITHLREKYRVFLLSNTNEIHIHSFEDSLKKANLLDLYYSSFEKVYYSCRMRKRKPNKDCFEMVLQESNLVPSETIFIDDSIQHIEGAKKTGIKAYLMGQNSSIIDFVPDIIQ